MLKSLYKISKKKGKQSKKHQEKRNNNQF